MQRIEGLSTIARGVGIAVVGLLFLVVSNFIYQLVLARSLSTAEVGIFNLALITIGLVELVVLFGLDNAVVRNIAFYAGRGERQREIGVIKSSLVILMVLVAILLPISWLVVDDVVMRLFNKPELVPVLKIFLLGLPFTVFTRLILGILLGYKIIRPTVWIEQVIVPVLRILGLLLVVGLLINRLWIPISFVAAAVVGFAIAAVVLWRSYPSVKSTTRSTFAFRELLAFSWPLLFAALLNRTNMNTETFVMGMVSTSDEIGIFTVCFKIATTLTIFFRGANVIMAPFMAEFFGRSEINRLEEQLKIVTRWVFSITLPFAAIMFLTAQDIMGILGAGFSSGALVLRVLLLSQFFFVAIGPVALLLNMTKYNKVNLFDLVLSILLSLVLDFYLIPRLGAIGAAIASALSIIFISTLRLGQIYRAFRIQPFGLSYFKPIFAGIVAITLSFLLGLLLADLSYYLHILIVSSALLLSYTGALLLLRLEKTDRVVLNTILRRIGFVYPIS